MTYHSDYFNEWHPHGCRSSFQAAETLGTLTTLTRGNYERRETRDSRNTAAGRT